MITRKTAAILFLVLILGMVAYIIQTTHTSEPFQEDVLPQRCGVGLPSCRPQEGNHMRCINGWCRSDRIH